MRFGLFDLPEHFGYKNYRIQRSIAHNERRYI
jgi:hypothetical protein